MRLKRSAPSATSTGGGGLPLTRDKFIRDAIANHADAVKSIHVLLKIHRLRPSSAGSTPPQASLRHDDEVEVAAMTPSEPTSSSCRYNSTMIDFWAACSMIPAGYVATYSTLSYVIQGVRGERTLLPSSSLQVASRDDAPVKAKYARVAGLCMSKNVLYPVIPCHRVVGTSGSLTGYVEGLPKKAALLRQEGVPVEAITPQGANIERFVVRHCSGRVL